MTMRRFIFFIAFLLMVMLLSCSTEPEIDWAEQAVEARIELIASGMLVGEPTLNDETVSYSIILIKSENEYLLEGKAVRSPFLKISWTINTTIHSVFNGRVPKDEGKINDMEIVWLYNYIFKEA